MTEGTLRSKRSDLPFVPATGFWLQNISGDRFEIVGYPPFEPDEKRLFDKGQGPRLYRYPDGFIHVGCIAFAVTYQGKRHWFESDSTGCQVRRQESTGGIIELPTEEKTSLTIRRDDDTGIVGREVSDFLRLLGHTVAVEQDEDGIVITVSKE